jgi:hypothetical protein
VYRGKDDNWHPSPPIEPLPYANLEEASVTDSSRDAPVLTLRRKRQLEVQKETANVR